MRPLIAHDLRVATRRAAWPIALGLHLVAATLFVAVWGPTGGVSLWLAPLLAQWVAADRILVAVLLTWLVTPLFAPGADVDLVGWSGVTGLPVRRLVVARAAAAMTLAVVLTLSATPITVAAAQMSAQPVAALLAASLEMAVFALLAVGLTAGASVVWRHQLAVWCTGMALTAVAAFGVRLLSPGPPRIATCAVIAIAGIAAAAGTATHRWAWLEETRL